MTTPLDKKEAIIWARVSTQEQARVGYSVGDQIDKLRDYCDRNKLNILREFKISESSSKGEKKAFNEMIKFVEKQKRKINIIVDKVDRLNRQVNDLPKIFELIDKNKAEFFFLDIGYLNSDANTQQKLMLRMMTVIANTYTDSLSDHGKRTYLHKVENGECPRIAPIGYLNITDGNKKTVIFDKLLAPLIKKMFEMYSLGSYSLGDLEKFAHKHNIKNNFFKGRPATLLSKNVISEMLKNPFYCGFIRCKKYNKLYPHKYEKLVSEELFAECQKIKEGRANQNNRQRAIRTSKEGKDFVFRSLIKCAITGRTVTCDEKIDKRGYQNTYLITRNPQDVKKRVFVREKDILDKISQTFKSMQFPQELLDSLTQYIQKAHKEEQEYYKIKINDIESKIRLEEAKYNNLMDMRLTRTEDQIKSITKSYFEKREIEIQNNIDSLEKERTQYKQVDRSFKSAIITAYTMASELYDVFSVSNNSEKRQFVNYVFSKLELRGKNLEFTLRKPFDIIVESGCRNTWLHG